MSFLEAMALGLCVVAPRSPTMDEYISDGTTGLLYSLGHRQSLDFSRIREIGQRARKSVELGHSRWLKGKDELLDFIATPLEEMKARERAARMLARISWTDIIEEKHDVAAPSPKVSVVTVCRNAASTIEKTINSVLGQNYENLEYIIIDGLSTDKTPGIIGHYAERLTLWKSEKDSGVYDAMNKSIDLCTGEWILFMNAGDLFVGPNALSRMFASNVGDVDVLYGHHLYIGNDGFEEFHSAADFENTWSKLIHGETYNIWLSGVPCHQSTAVRKNILEELRFDNEYLICADHDLMYKARKNGARFFNTNETISIYQGGGLSAQKYDRCIREWVKIAGIYGGPLAALKLYSGLIETTEPTKTAPFNLPNKSSFFERRVAEGSLTVAKMLKSIGRAIPLARKASVALEAWGTKRYNVMVGR